MKDVKKALALTDTQEVTNLTYSFKKFQLGSSVKKHNI